MDDLEELSEDLSSMLAAAEIRPPVDPRTIRMRHSILKNMSLSPAHLYHACQQPSDDSLAAKFATCAPDKKEALRFGTACHEMLLGDPKKVSRCSMRRDMRTKAFKEYVDAATKDGVVAILSDREHMMATSLVEAVWRSDLAMRALFETGTIHERKIEWEYLGRAFRATPDARRTKAIVDLKTSRSSNPQWFSREAIRQCYHTQVRLYADAAKEITGVTVEEYLLVVVEKAAPYCVTVFKFEPDVLDLADRTLRLWMERLSVCEASGVWPQYSSAVVPIELDQDREEWAA